MCYRNHCKNNIHRQKVSQMLHVGNGIRLCLLSFTSEVGIVSKCIYAVMELLAILEIVSFNHFRCLRPLLPHVVEKFMWPDDVKLLKDETNHTLSVIHS